MKKYLLPIFVFSLLAPAASADQCFTYADADGYSIYGAARRVSPNGRWICGGDDYDETGAFVIDTTDPANHQFTPDGMLLDINDEGVAVGAWYYDAGNGARYSMGATYRDGKWKTLPVPEASLSGQSTAVSISRNSKRICGFAVCANANPDEPGKQFPVVWDWDEDTHDYVVSHIFNDLFLPGTFGFQVTDMTPDGRWIVGYQGLNLSDPICVAMNLETGEFRNFHDIEERDVTLVIPHPVTGEDVTFITPEIFVDGFQNGCKDNPEFSSYFLSCDNRYAYGARNEVYDVDANGIGKLRTIPTIYDLDADKFYDGRADAPYAYLCGDGPRLQFTTDGSYVYSGKVYSIAEDFDTQGKPVSGIYDMDSAGHVLVGSHAFIDAVGKSHESPVVLILDVNLGAVPLLGDDSAFPAKVSVANGFISVEGANDVAIFALNGATLSRAHRVAVSPGVYLVMADGHTVKVIVK